MPDGGAGCDLGDGRLDDLSYQFVKRGDPATAIRTFALNVEAYAESWNPHDGLDEALNRVGIDVTREERQLLAEATGQPKVKLLLVLETRFYALQIDAYITFSSVGSQVQHLTLEADGEPMPAERVEGD